jgi:hypothetical protein
LEKLVLLPIVNQLEMQVLGRLYKVQEVNHSSRLYKVLGVIQSSSRTLIGPCPISLLMEIWRSVLLEFHLTLLIE